MTRLSDLGLIAGSNISGKSTFMRTVGINLSLAYAGGPVDAVAMQTRMFRLFTCLKVSDSVTDGFGLIATHDLALVRLADEIGHIQPYHFRDQVRDGQMVFNRYSIAWWKIYLGVTLKSL